MNLQSKFDYCITTQILNISLYIGGTELWSDRQMDIRTIQLLDAFGGPLRLGGGGEMNLYLNGIAVTQSYLDWLSFYDRYIK